jgi:hypothetical protein
MMHDEEYCLHNDLGSAWGESGEGETHESDIKRVAGQFKFLGQTLQLCEAWKTLASLLSENWGCPDRCLLRRRELA